MRPNSQPTCGRDLLEATAMILCGVLNSFLSGSSKQIQSPFVRRHFQNFNASVAAVHE
ncbi:hypothetical protein A2U01_0030476 [Trifolium medium]|uniref:Uncharacterized protein n=1 Tax=Trifolium medium TaxID=97028 RepID=A0A392PD51_9FABA|nr:hypothetical protein [Trifolium medium]